MTQIENLPSLAGLSLPLLQEKLLGLGVPEKQTKMRANKLWRWMYAHGVREFDAMSDVSKDMRSQLDANFSLNRPKIITEQISIDGTRKWVIALKGENDTRQHLVEMVYIPEAERGTLCVSSQVGCTLACTFCHTGTQKLVRNLTAAEIVGQLLIARDALNDWPHMSPETGAIVPQNGSRFVSNIVFMGMGEPLYNLDEVKTAIDVMSSDSGLAISRRKITVSTAGVVPEIHRLGEQCGTMLAISLHAPNDETRNKLVPINKKYPIAQLLDACRNYPGVSNARRITFEYVMLNGVNDSLKDAKELVKILEGIPAKINLIPFNPWPNSVYECSSWEQIERFAEVLNKAGFSSPVRTPRGRDIFAACGQLKSETERLSIKERKALEEGVA